MAGRRLRRRSRRRAHTVRLVFVGRRVMAQDDASGHDVARAARRCHAHRPSRRRGGRARRPVRGVSQTGRVAQKRRLVGCAFRCLEPARVLLGKFVDLTSSAEGFVALGWGPSSTGTVTPIFASRDGRTWVVEATVPVAAGERFLPSGVTAVGGRLFVTGGSVVGGATEGRIFVWDGMEWTTIEPRASGMTGTGENQVASVAYRRGIGFVAGGVPGGATWEAVPPSPRSERSSTSSPTGTASRSPPWKEPRAASR